MSHSLPAGIRESSHHEPPTSIQEGDGLERSITIGDRVLSAGSSDFSHGEGKGVGFSEAATVERIGVVAAEGNPSGVGVDGGVESMSPLFLAIGVGNSGEGEGATISTPTEDSRGVEGPKDEDYYRQLVEEQPCNGLYLRDYARFLYQAKQGLEKAEEYYSRAILARPGDGEALSEYAKLIWERNHDYGRSLCYFEQAAEIAPDDSHVLAAYAHFLWITEDFEQGKEDGSQNECFVGLPVTHESPSHEPPTSTLETIPSFDVYNLRGEEADGLHSSITIQDRVLSTGSDFSFGEGKGVGFAGATAAERSEGVEENPSGLDGLLESLPPLFIAKGLRIGIDDGNSSEFVSAMATPTEDSSGVEGPKDENYYRLLVEEQPCNGLYLRDYARFLYQAKQDLEKAEEYYSRAILARPGDGEVFSEYAKVIWERHHDYERSLCYFEQAVEVAPEDSHVLAAYAHFLWIAEDAEQGKPVGDQNEFFVGLPVTHGEMASASAA